MKGLMKPFLKSASFATLLALGIATTSCMRDKCEYTYTYDRYVPEYMSFDELRAADAVKSEPARVLTNPGKIFIKDQFLFVNEYNQGVHVINNADPSNPQAVSFIKIPGNVDIAVNGSALYADSHVDLLVIDISNPANPTLLKRLENALPYPEYSNGVQLDPTKGVVNNWKVETVTETVQYDCGFGGAFENPDGIGQFDAALEGNSLDGGRNMSTGQGGSMARFALSNYFLYVVTPEEMLVFDVTSPGNPSFGQQISIPSGNVETIYPADGHLYLGTSNGMFIYDNSSPYNPIPVGELTHSTSCDPVVEQDGLALVTLRGGTPCGGFTNQFDVVDVSNPSSPWLVRSYPVDGPFGVGIDGTTAFVCDGNSGVRVYDVSDPANLIAIDRVQGMNAWDVIPHNNVLILTGEDGIYQFDYSNPNNLTQLSKLPIVR